MQRVLYQALGRRLSQLRSRSASSVKCQATKYTNAKYKKEEATGNKQPANGVGTAQITDKDGPKSWMN